MPSNFGVSQTGITSNVLPKAVPQPSLYNVTKPTKVTKSGAVKKPKKVAIKNTPHALLWICCHGKGQKQTWSGNSLKVLGLYHNIITRKNITLIHNTRTQVYMQTRSWRSERRNKSWLATPMRGTGTYWWVAPGTTRSTWW